MRTSAILDAIRSAGSTARSTLQEIVQATAPPLPPIRGLTEESGVLIADGDPAIGHLLFCLYVALPHAPPILSPTTHFAGAHGAVVTLTGLTWGSGEILLSVRVPAGNSSLQLVEMMTLAGFHEVWGTHIDEWVWP